MNVAWASLKEKQCQKRNWIGTIWTNSRFDFRNLYIETECEFDVDGEGDDDGLASDDDGLGSEDEDGGLGSEDNEGWFSFGEDEGGLESEDGEAESESAID